MRDEVKRPLVVMVDDDEDDCFLVGTVFREREMPYRLSFLHDGRELLEYLDRMGGAADAELFPEPDLILLDLNMPRMGGREVLAIVKADPMRRHIPVVILSTSSEPRDIELCRRSGAAAFITKPARLDDLADSLEQTCKSVLESPDLPFRVIGR